jgi:hypothetical protein
MKIVQSAVLGIATAIALSGCGQRESVEPPLAKPSLTLSHDAAPLGSPIEITYRFDVDANPPSIRENYKVFVHVLDSDEELMWTDDHDPPIPTTQWKPGQQVEYKRTVFVPLYPYVGEAAIRLGLYSGTNQKRVSLSGENVGQHEYRVGKLQLLPQTDNIFTAFRDGWHLPETPVNDARIEWQWTKKREATLAFKNPKKDSTFYFEVDNPSKAFPEGQQVQVKLGGRVLDDFNLKPEQLVLHKIPLPATLLGTEEIVDLTIAVDKTFVPALIPEANNKDPRELGIRVFHAFIQPNK